MEEENKKVYPLQWPVGYKRSSSRTWSQFKQTPDKAQQFLRKQLDMMDASRVVISSNVPVRQNGLMYADAMRRAKQQDDDPGVSVYFHYKGKPVVICCDTYSKVWENVYAIGRTIENLRAIDRYGVSDFLARSFTGFMELPPSLETPYKKPWYVVLNISSMANAGQIKAAYKALAMQLHPDKGHHDSKFVEVKAAYDEAMNSLTSK